MMQSLSEKIRKGAVMLSDGAWGTNLQSKGLKAGTCPELWNAEYPELVQSVAKEFITAGAQLVKTNSFGGSRYKLEGFGLEHRVSELNEKAAQCSRRAAGSDVYVLGSMGPTGRMLITGEVTADDLYKAFSEQAKALEHGGADVILVETLSDLQEAKIAVAAARDATDCEIACTMTFEQTVDDEYKTMMGVSPTEMVADLREQGVHFLGSNCGNGIEQMIPIVKEIRAAEISLPVIIHANAGMPQLKNGKTVFPESPEEMAAFVPELIEAGANIIGGCCGTTPEHIRKMRENL
ncbi:MAG: homocysteine S-methyltransferase family protein [candidate division KSB1 bacterium]|nr:homocysteine S-methyltransferase family protein [candidate division KSB1 bacterium]